MILIFLGPGEHGQMDHFYPSREFDSPDLWPAIDMTPKQILPPMPAMGMSR